jgi:hypothetical protein
VDPLFSIVSSSSIRSRCRQPGRTVTARTYRMSDSHRKSAATSGFLSRAQAIRGVKRYRPPALKENEKGQSHSGP